MTAPRTKTEADGDTWSFLCECGFASTQWPTKKSATARGQQHTAEHESGELMQDIHEFREANNLMVNPDGSVSEKD